MNLTKEQAERILAALYGRACVARDRVNEIEAQIASLQIQLSRAKEEMIRAEGIYEDVRADFDPTKQSREQEKEAAVRMAVRMFGGDDKW